MSTQYSDNYKHYYVYASILLDNGNKTNALKVANQSLELAGSIPRAQVAVKQLIDKISAG